MKTIFITGTSSGLGKAAARLFHDKGWHVIATMRDTSKANDLSELEGVTILPLDISDPAQISIAAAKAIALGDIDVVLNNAAYGALGPLESMTDEQVIKQVDTNLLGAIRITQAFLPHFREKKSGLFVNITSIAALVTFPFASLYNTVKWGLQGFSEAMSYELKPFGVQIKTIAPGFIHSAFGANIQLTSTPAYQTLLDRNMEIVTSSMNPETSGSTPEEIAAVVYEAATDGKDQVLYVAGADAQGIYNRRLELGPEAARREMGTTFLGV